MKFIIKAMLLVSIIQYSYAAENPSRSKLDTRIQHLNYNASNVTSVNAIIGYATAINFSNDETVKDVAVGFNQGWEVVNRVNSIYVKPIAFKANRVVIEPNAKDWKTNLIIKTNKRNYVFVLNLVPLDNKMAAFLINFKYPTDIANEKAVNDVRMKISLAKEKQSIANKKINISITKSLTDFTIPRNWDYAMKIGDKSNSITPNFTYDDGVRTYIGFDTSKSIPSIFYYQGGEEMMSNVSVRRQGNYSVVIVHKTAPRFIMRSGDQVVGIENLSYGKFISEYKNTSSDNVKRVIK